MKTDGAFYITLGWIGRLALVIVLTAILLASSLFVFVFNFYYFAPALIGYYLGAYLLARRSFYSLVSLGYSALLLVLLWLYFASVGFSSCCGGGGGGGVSDDRAALLLGIPTLLIGYGLWRALPGRKARENTAPAGGAAKVSPRATAAPPVISLGRSVAVILMSGVLTGLALLSVPFYLGDFLMVYFLSRKSYYSLVCLGYLVLERAWVSVLKAGVGPFEACLMTASVLFIVYGLLRALPPRLPGLRSISSVESTHRNV